jgi:hypothetical protein
VLAEHQVVVLPRLAGAQAYGQLSLAVLAQQFGS